MDNEKQAWRRRLVYWEIFLGALTIVILIGIIGGAILTTAEDRSMIQHKFILLGIDQHLDKGGELPADLAELATLEYEFGRAGPCSLEPLVSFEKEMHGLKYHPEYWDEPGRIVLQSKVWGSYVVAFSDRSRAVLRRWRYKAGVDSVEFEDNSYLWGSGPWGTPVGLGLLGLILVSFICIVITERILKFMLRKTRAKQ